MENYKTGLEGKSGDARLIVDCPVMGTIAIEWCGECEYCRGRESLSGGKRRPDKEGVICGAPMWRVAKKIILNSQSEREENAEKEEGGRGSGEEKNSFGFFRNQNPSSPLPHLPPLLRVRLGFSDWWRRLFHG